MTLSVGDVAPGFVLTSQHGEAVSLSSFRGRNVVVVFFPFAFSGVCTGELAAIRDHLEAFEADDAQVLTISCDSVFSNRAFADRDGYTFPILSDFWPHGDVSRAYGSLDERSGAPRRGSFVIDRDGVVRWTVVNDIGEARDLADYRTALAALA